MKRNGNVKVKGLLTLGFFVVALTIMLLMTACHKPASSTPHGLVESIEKASDNSDASGVGIVNGKVVGKKGTAASKSVVALIVKHGERQALCTGTLIGKNSVLTAAHCVDGNPSFLAIVFNKDLSQSQESDRRVADAYAQHPRWKNPGEEGRGDLALVHFHGETPAGYHPVSLAPTDLTLTPGNKITLVGYGVDDGLHETGSGILRYTKTEVLRQHSSTEVLFDGRSSGVCFGDSGGPAFIRHKNKLVQWGVASFVTSRDCKQYGVHTAVMSYLDWIAKIQARFEK